MSCSRRRWPWSCSSWRRWRSPTGSKAPSLKAQNQGTSPGSEGSHSLSGPRQQVLLNGLHDRCHVATRLIFVNSTLVVLHLVWVQRIAAGVLAGSRDANPAPNLECHQRVQMPRPSIGIGAEHEVFEGLHPGAALSDTQHIISQRRRSLAGRSDFV